MATTTTTSSTCSCSCTKQPKRVTPLPAGGAMQSR